MTRTGHSSFSLSSEKRDHGSEGHTHEDEEVARAEPKGGSCAVAHFLFFSGVNRICSHIPSLLVNGKSHCGFTNFLRYFEAVVANSKRTWDSREKHALDSEYDPTTSWVFLASAHPSSVSTENIPLSIRKMSDLRIHLVYHAGESKPTHYADAKFHRSTHFKISIPCL